MTDAAGRPRIGAIDRPGPCLAVASASTARIGARLQQVHRDRRERDGAGREAVVTTFGDKERLGFIDRVQVDVLGFDMVEPVLLWFNEGTRPTPHRAEPDGAPLACSLRSAARCARGSRGDGSVPW